MNKPRRGFPWRWVSDVALGHLPKQKENNRCRSVVKLLTPPVIIKYSCSNTADKSEMLHKAALLVAYLFYQTKSVYKVIMFSRRARTTHVHLGQHYAMLGRSHSSANNVCEAGRFEQGLNLSVFYLTGTTEHGCVCI